VDVLTDVLQSLRLRSSVYCRSELGAPWGLHFLPMPGAVFHCLQHGQGILRVEGDDRWLPLTAGDVVVLPRGEGHLILDAPGSPIFRDLRLDQWGECALMRWSESPSASLLCGAFEIEHDAQHPLFNFLPRVLCIGGRDGRPHPALAAVLSVMAAEAEAGQPGREIALRRLADVLFIQIIRYWIETQGKEARGWLGALRDTQIGQALAAIHGHPARAWTVETLAAEAALSRSAFAARFTALVGEPPLQYLTRWRMRTAAGLLQNRRLALAEIAQRVGYESEVAFSKAFKRELGITPGAHRRPSRVSETVAPTDRAIPSTTGLTITHPIGENPV
jgi:AraC-like DNA-binding protein